MIVVAVDPGARWTGVTAREGSALLGYRIVDRAEVEPGADRPGVATMEAVVAVVAELGDPIRCLIAGEDVVAPTAWHKGKIQFTDVEPLLRAAEVLGYVEAAYPGLRRVRPDKHGRQPLVTYPRALVTQAEARAADRMGGVSGWHRPAGQSAVIRHARSAWDIAGTAAAAARIERSAMRSRGR